MAKDVDGFENLVCIGEWNCLAHPLKNTLYCIAHLSEEERNRLFEQIKKNIPKMENTCINSLAK